MRIKYVFEIHFIIIIKLFFIKNAAAKLPNNKLLYNINCDKHIPTANVVNTCFTNKSDPIVLLVNNSYWKCTEMYEFEKDPNVVIKSDFKESDNIQRYINKKKNFKLDSQSNQRFKRSPAKKFILIEINVNYLPLALMKLKISKWWNSNGFFIIENTQFNDNCKAASDYLRVVWKFNILSAVFFCTDNNSNTQMYTFNPYNFEAPLNWIEQYSLNTTDGYLTLFKQQYNDSIDVCETVNFDKTHYVANYVVKLCVMKIFYDPNVTTAFKIAAQLGKIAETIWNFLNANVSLILVDDNGIIDDDGFATNALADVIDGKFDMNTVYDYQREIWEYEINTFISTGQCYVTKDEKMKIIEYITKLLSSPFFFVGLVYISITTMFQAFFMKTNACEALLDIIRALIGVSMIKQTNSRSERLFLIWNVFFFVIIGSYFQSCLCSLFTTYPIHPVNIKTSDDLFKYKVYATDYTKQYFVNRSIYNKISHVNDFEECMSLMYKFKGIACIEDCTLLKLIPLNVNAVTVSTDELIRRYFVLVHREDFPLRKRVQQIYNRMFQHGIIKYIQNSEQLASTSANLPSLFNPISLKDLEFTFQLYIFCVIVSFAVLFVEIVKKKLYLKCTSTA